MENCKETQIKAWICNKCGRIYGSEYTASICCKQYHCETCGCETSQYILMCEDCKETRDYNNATKMTIEEYETKFPGFMVCYNDEFYSSAEDILDTPCGDGIPAPKYCWGTDEHWLELEADNILNGMEEDSDCEDLEFQGAAYNSLRDFAEEWNKKYRKNFYSMNNKIAILIPEELAKEYTE